MALTSMALASTEQGSGGDRQSAMANPEQRLGIAAVVAICARMQTRGPIKVVGLRGEVWK